MELVYRSHLLLDFDAQPSWLAIANDDLMNSYCDTARDHNASSELIKDLTERKKILFFSSEAERQLPVSEWTNFLHPCHPIPAKPGYYYSLIKDSSIYEFPTGLITSYHNFLSENKNK